MASIGAKTGRLYRFTGQHRHVGCDAGCGSRDGPQRVTISRPGKEHGSWISAGDDNLILAVKSTYFSIVSKAEVLVGGGYLDVAVPQGVSWPGEMPRRGR